MLAWRGKRVVPIHSSGRGLSAAEGTSNYGPIQSRELISKQEGGVPAVCRRKDQENHTGITSLWRRVCCLVLGSISVLPI